jgi:hypothetical protein
MRLLGSMIIEAADNTKVPAGSALAVDRDKFSAYIKCLEENNYGNREFLIAGERLLDAIKSMKCAEADYFLENFLEPFSLPIDSIIEKE